MKLQPLHFEIADRLIQGVQRAGGIGVDTDITRQAVGVTADRIPDIERGRVIRACCVPVGHDHGLIDAGFIHQG